MSMIGKLCHAEKERALRRQVARAAVSAISSDADVKATAQTPGPEPLTPRSQTLTPKH